MIVLLTNTSGHTMNDLDSYSFGSGPSALLAVGGNRHDPFPYPFSHVGPVLASGTKTLPMRASDFWFKAVPGLPSTPAQEWSVLIQAGKVTLGYTAETTFAASLRDPEERFITAAV